MRNMKRIFASIALLCAFGGSIFAAGPKIRFAMKDLDTDPNAGAFVALIEKGMAEAGTPIDIELVKIPAGNYAEKVSLMIMSGDVPDLIYFQGNDDKLAAQGVLEDLRPYLAKSKYLKGILDPHSKARVSNYPYLIWPAAPRVRTPVIRADWAALPTGKALLKNPTPQAYEAFFKELKAKKGVKYGITAAGSVDEFDAIFNAAFGETSTWIKGADGKWGYSKVSSGEKAKLEYYARLYNEGLIDPEFLTKKWDTKEKAFYEGQAGVIVGFAPGSTDVYESKMKKSNGVDITVLPPAKGIAQGYAPFVNLTKEDRGFAISAVSKNKAAAFALLDFMWSPKGLKIAKLGIPGIHYNDDGKTYVLTEKYAEWYNGWFGESFNGFKADKPLSRPLLTKAGSDSAAMAIKYMLSDKTFLVPDQFTANWDAMENLYKEYAADIVTGKKPISAFDEFVDKWNKAGGVDVTKYANTILK
jgi:putative aldouronate transport system substrate-binding protein